MPTEEQVWQALRAVTDPEYPLNIVDLGMVYGVRLDGDRVHVEMTFTSAGCPAIEMLTADVHDVVGDLRGVGAVVVEVVWDPPWTRDRISERGRKVLAMFGVVS